MGNERGGRRIDADFMETGREDGGRDADPVGNERGGRRSDADFMGIGRENGGWRAGENLCKAQDAGPTSP